MKVSQQEYNLFPHDFSIKNQVFQYYFELWKSEDDYNKFSNSQKALCLFFICEGIIDNGGFASLLLETKGEYNSKYLEVLKFLDAKESLLIFKEISNFYNKYKNDLSIGEWPNIFNEESKLYNKEIHYRILEILEKSWYNLASEREEKLNTLLEKRKDEIIELK